MLPRPSSWLERGTLHSQTFPLNAFGVSISAPLSEVMHYSRNRLTASVTTITYTSTTDHQACPACPLVSSSRTKPYQFSSVLLRSSLVSPLVFSHNLSTGGVDVYRGRCRMTAATQTSATHCTARSLTRRRQQRPTTRPTRNTCLAQPRSPARSPTSPATTNSHSTRRIVRSLGRTALRSGRC